MIDAASELMKNSPLPRPMTMGLLWRAAMISSVFPSSITAMAYAPMTLPSAILTASARLQPLLSLMHSIRFTSTSESVSLLNL